MKKVKSNSVTDDVSLAANVKKNVENVKKGKLNKSLAKLKITHEKRSKNKKKEDNDGDDDKKDGENTDGKENKSTLKKELGELNLEWMSQATDYVASICTDIYSTLWFDPDMLFNSKDEYPLKFPPKDKIPDTSIAFLGQRRTGKSVATNHLMKVFMPYIDGVWVITGTKENGYWQDCGVPKSCIFPLDQATEAVVSLTKYQRDKLKMIERGEWEEKMGKRSPYIMIILEDWIQNDRLARYNKHIKTLFTAGRHFFICCVAISQYARAISTYIRYNTDFAFIFSQNDHTNMEAVIEDHVGQIYDTNLVRTMVTNVTHAAPHVMLVVDKRPPKEAGTQPYYIWRANPDLPQIPVGSQEWRDEIEEVEQYMDISDGEGADLMSTLLGI